jgi:hypothetical protein
MLDEKYQWMKIAKIFLRNVKTREQTCLDAVVEFS